SDLNSQQRGSTICFRTHWYLLLIVSTDIYTYSDRDQPHKLSVMPPKKTASLVVLLFFAFLYGSVYARGNSAAATTTEPTPSSRSVAIGAAVTLTATVLLGSTPVRCGSVVFCDAN